MIFLSRSEGPDPQDADLRIVARRRTPGDEAGLTDLFCVADEATYDRLVATGLALTKLRDGWYADDGQGGVAIWGAGRYWEVRDTPFTIVERAGPGGRAPPRKGSRGNVLDVRGQIFGAVP